MVYACVMLIKISEITYCRVGINRVIKQTNKNENKKVQTVKGFCPDMFAMFKSKP